MISSEIIKRKTNLQPDYDKTMNKKKTNKYNKQKTTSIIELKAPDLGQTHMARLDMRAHPHLLQCCNITT